MSGDDARAAGQALLERFGLGDRAGDYPDRLSGGQQQRVAIARALMTRPRALLLDEVTSALDPELVGEVLDLIRELKEEGMTILIATHEMSFARDFANEVCFLADGRIVERGPPDADLQRPDRARDTAVPGSPARSQPDVVRVHDGRPGRVVVPSPGERRQSPRRLVDHLRALAEREPHERAAGVRVVVEDARRDRDDAAALGQRRGRTRRASVAERATSALTKYVPCGTETAEARPRAARRTAVALGPQVAAQAARVALGRRSAAATAGCSGVPPANVRNCLAARDRGDELGRPGAQPIFQPVNENVLPALEIVSVRSAIPGSVASGMCSPS